MEQKLLSKDFICGLITGEGSFSVVYHKINRQFVPTFEIRMHIRDKELVELIRDSIGLDSEETRIHEYIHAGHHYAGFIVRKRSILLNIIIPYFKNCLRGYKKVQFEEWANFIRVMNEARMNKKLNKLILTQERDRAIFQKYGI